MGQKAENGINKSNVMNAVSRTLSSIYTGVFFIDLVSDTYLIVKAVKSVEAMLEDITSAQQAINLAIKRTVYADEMVDMLTFVNLATLPGRMEHEKILNTDYRGVISGWVRGSFMEVERDSNGKLTQILYAYQVIDEEKRKELEHLEELKRNYAINKKKSKEKRIALEEDNQILQDDLKYHNNFTEIVMKQLSCGIMVYTIPGRHLIEINQEALRIFDWKDKKEAEEKFIGKWEGIRLTNNAQEMQLMKLREEESSVKYQFVLNQGLKTEKIILGESKSVSGRHGGKVIVTILTDATDIRNLEAEKLFLTDANTELQRARDAVQTILKAGSYLCAYAEDGENLISIKFSDALRKLYGYTGKEDAPDTWDMWLQGAYPEDRAYVEQSYYAALRDRTGNTNYDVTFRALKKDGTICWYRAAAYIIRRSDGTAEFSYGLIMDVDEQRRAEEQVKEALYQAEVANAAKTSFLARMSHDIRTPMNGIMGLIEINERHADDIEFTSKNRMKAKVAADHLLSLINDILQLSKLEDSVVEFSCEPFDLLELSDDVLIITEQRAKEKGISIERNDDPSIFEYPYVYGSPLHVKQIFINILSNSIKYNKEHGSILCHAAMEKKEENRVLYKVEIKDTGIGMSEEFIQHLFDPFSREKEELVEGREGTGLGMSIVKRLLDKMGGNIQVKSIQGVGSSFAVEIPFKLASKEALKDMEEKETVKDISGRHILLVEDNALNMDIAETLLADAGVKVTKAVNGQQAVNIYEKNAPGTFDAILMDVMMPIMNGYEATRKIRSADREDAGKIPIIAITANAFTEDVECALKAGMNDHLSKPLEVQKMISTIAKYIKN